VLPLVTVAATVVGWGLVTNTAAGWLNWQGYLLKPVGLGGKSGSWAARTSACWSRSRSASSSRWPCPAAGSARQEQPSPDGHSAEVLPA
jgi:hypothetical protein